MSVTPEQAGEFLRNLRLTDMRNGKPMTQPQLAELLGLNSYNYVSNMEHGLVDWRAGKYCAAIIREFNVTAEQARSIGVQIALDHRTPGTATLERSLEVTGIKRSPAVAFYGSIQGGGPQAALRGHKMKKATLISCPLPGVLLYPEDQLFALRVTEETLASRKVRGSRKPIIVPGNYILFVRPEATQSRAGDFVIGFVADLGTKGTGILCAMGETGQKMTLKSYDNQLAPSPQQYVVQIQGTYLGQWSMDEGRLG